MSIGTVPATPANFNGAFASKSADNTMTGIQALENTDPDSGNDIVNLQQIVNEIRDTVGIVGEGDPNRKIYTSNFVVDDGDDLNVAASKLDAAIGDPNTAFAVSSLNTLTGIVNIIGITGGAILVEVDGQSINLSLDLFSRGKLAQATLLDNTADQLVSANTIAANSGRLYNYTITRGAGKVRVGTVYLVNDGTETAIVDNPALEIGDVGVTFSTDIQNLAGQDSQTLLATTTSTGTDAKILVEFMNFPKPV